MPGSGDWEAQRADKRVPCRLGHGILPSERTNEETSVKILEVFFVQYLTVLLKDI